MSLNELAERIETDILGITPELTPDQVAEVRLRVNAFMEHAKKLKAACDEAMIQYITGTGKPIVIGPVRYYVGDRKETKCRDQVEATQTLVEQFGPEHVARNFLSTGALKHGAIRKEVDAETYDRLFEVVSKPVLKEDGTPEKQLQSIDERFIR